ncbi:MAG: Na/Pi cotransporter family protein [Clostridia bacterium]|nr:Na/Pi cotransporter family protein [Clostridia bacterium]
MNIFNVISLFGGLALFLYGMRIMGDGLRQSSSKAFKKAVSKVTNNPVASFLVGLLLTAIIQSSTATIVITSGLVGAGLLTLDQSLGIIIGANVGTTITGQIIRLMDIGETSSWFLNIFKPSTLAPIAAIIGIVVIMAFKFQGADKVGEITMGFGILFTGLLNMTAAVTPLSNSRTFANLFISLSDKPFLGFLAGAAAAFIIQSSSATVGILQALSITGQLTLGSVYSIIMGIYIGDCVTTAIVCSIGAKADAKRVGIVHIIFNLCQIVLIAIVMHILSGAGVFGSTWNAAITSGGIANVNTIFKLCGAIIFLPFCKLFKRLSQKIVKDDKEEQTVYAEAQLLDPAFYRTPSLAFSACNKAITSIANAANENFKSAISMLLNYDESIFAEIEKKEDFIDAITDSTSDYIIKLAPHVDAHGNGIINFNIKCAEEFERIGDLSINLAEIAQGLNQRDVVFSNLAKDELNTITDLLNEILELANKSFATRDVEAAKRIEPMEEVVDEMCEYLRNRHVDRLKQGLCNADAGSAFLDMLVNIERISDQCSNVGVHTLSLFNAKIANAQHEYLNALHKGADQNFNRIYEETKEKYLKSIEA